MDALALPTPAPPIVVDTTIDHTHDLVAIREVVQTIETGFNANDAELMVAPFAENGSVVNVAGVLIAGRDTLLAAGRAGLAGPLHDEHARYELGDVIFLRPDLAVAHKLAWATTADGADLDPDPAMIALYVLVKEDGQWWVAARQNTLIPSTAAPS